MKRVPLCILFASVATTIFASTFIVPPDRELVRRADAIVVATAIRSESRPYKETGIETVTSFDVEETVRGFVPKIVDVRELNGRAVSIPGVPRFNDGERVLLFLRRTPSDTWAVEEIALGRFTFAED